MNERERSEGDCGTLTPGHALFQTFVGTRAWHQAQDFWARTIESSASVVEGDDPDDFLPAWVRGEQFYPHGDRSSLGSSSSVHAKGGKQLSPELSLHAAFTPWEKALLQDASRSLHSSHNTASASSCSSCRSSSSHSVMDSKTPPIPSYYGVNQLAILNHAGYKSGEFDSKNLRYIYRQTYAIRIGYVGSAYHGYQAQKRMHEGIRTVEEDVNLALGSTSCAAGRTDREVSAVSQVIGCVIKDPSLVGESHCRRLADDAVSLVSSVSRPAARSSRERSAIYRNAQQAQRNRAVFHSIEGTDDQAGAQKELDIKAGLDLEEAQSGTAETRSRKRVRSPSAVSSEPSAAAGTYSGGNVGDAIGPRSSACSGSRSVSCEENAKNVDKQEEEEGDRIRESILHRMRGSEPCRAGRLAVYDCYRVPRSFNARASATWRRYLYLFPLSASSDSTIERSSSSCGGIRSADGSGSANIPVTCGDLGIMLNRDIDSAVDRHRAGDAKHEECGESREIREGSAVSEGSWHIDMVHLNAVLGRLVLAGELPYNAFSVSEDRSRAAAGGLNNDHQQRKKTAQNPKNPPHSAEKASKDSNIWAGASLSAQGALPSDSSPHSMETQKMNNEDKAVDRVQKNDIQFNGQELNGSIATSTKPTPSMLDLCTLYLARAYLVDLHTGELVREYSENSRDLYNTPPISAGEVGRIEEEFQESVIESEPKEQLAVDAIRSAAYLERTQIPRGGERGFICGDRIEKRERRGNESGKEEEREGKRDLAICMELVGSRFLRRMVRIIAGTAIRECWRSTPPAAAALQSSARPAPVERKKARESGGENSEKEKEQLDVLERICRAGDRSLAARALPGGGLCFAGVGFSAQEMATHKTMQKVHRLALEKEVRDVHQRYLRVVKAAKATLSPPQQNHLH